MKSEIDVNGFLGKILQNLTDKELGAMACGFLLGAISEQQKDPCDIRDPRKIFSHIFAVLEFAPVTFKQVNNLAEIAKLIREANVEYTFNNILKEVQNEG